MNTLDLMYAMTETPDEILMEAEEFALPKQTSGTRRISALRLAAAMLALVLLVGCVAGTLEYRLWNGGSTQSWNRVDWIAANHQLQLPDTLLDAPFLDCDFLNLTDQPTSYLLGKLFPDYRYYTVNYGTEVTLRDYHRNDDGPGYTQWTERDEVIRVTFGSTANEYWRRQFGFNEENVWTGKPIPSADPVASETITRNGLTLYLATYESTAGTLSQRLCWYDYERGLVIQLQAIASDWDCLLEAADAILALNP